MMKHSYYEKEYQSINKTMNLIENAKKVLSINPPENFKNMFFDFFAENVQNDCEEVFIFTL